MTAAAHMARDGVRINVAHPDFTDTAMVRSADQDGLFPALEGFAIPGAATPAEIVGYVTFFDHPQPRECHAGRRQTATRWIDIIAALHTRAVR